MDTFDESRISDCFSIYVNFRCIMLNGVIYDILKTKWKLMEDDMGLNKDSAWKIKEEIYIPFIQKRICPL